MADMDTHNICAGRSPPECKGIIAGIAISAVLGSLFLLFLCFLFYDRHERGWSARRRHKRRRDIEISAPHCFTPNTTTETTPSTSGPIRVEVAGGLGAQGIETPRKLQDDREVVSKRYDPGDQEHFVVGTDSVDGEEDEASGKAPDAGMIAGEHIPAAAEGNIGSAHTG